MVGLVFQHVDLEIIQTSLSIHLSVDVQVTFMSSYDQGSNPGLLHCREILYHLSHQEALGRPSTIPMNHLFFSFFAQEALNKVSVTCKP